MKEERDVYVPDCTGGEKQMLLIVNPCSGKGRIKNHLLEITDIFIKAGWQVQIYVSQRALDAMEAVSRYGAGMDLIVCSGGDGTLNEVVSGIMKLEHTPQLGYIPAGSTNDFASSLRISKNMGRAARAIVEGRGCPIDIGCFCGERYFMYVAGFGAFTEVAYLTPQDKKNLLGHQAYVLEGVKSLSAIKAYHMAVEWEEGQIEGDFIFGMVTNTVSVGGFKGLVSQEVALDDGLFEVLLIGAPRTPLEFSNIVSKLIMREEDSGMIRKFKAKRLFFQSLEPVDWVLDGEFGGTRTEAEIVNLNRRIEILKNTAK